MEMSKILLLPNGSYEGLLPSADTFLPENVKRVIYASSRTNFADTGFIADHFEVQLSAAVTASDGITFTTKEISYCLHHGLKNERGNEEISVLLAIRGARSVTTS